MLKILKFLSHRRAGRMDGMSGRLELLDQRTRRAPHALLPPAGDDQRVGMVERPFRDLLAGDERHVHVRTRRERHRLLHRLARVAQAVDLARVVDHPQRTRRLLRVRERDRPPHERLEARPQHDVLEG